MSAQQERQEYVTWLAERLSDRDWRIIETVNHLRVVSGNQLERLCFAALTGHTRAVVRGRVLRRLVACRLLTLLPRRIGGTLRGSSGSVFALGTVGARVCAERQGETLAQQRIRQPGVPTERTVRHMLAVSELYVSLVEQAWTQGAQVVALEAEPASWCPNGLGGFLKPDAYICLSLGKVREHWWIEVDLATESLPTIRRKLLAYVDFVERGQFGPGNLIPRVLISASTRIRCAAFRSLITRLPMPAAGMFVALVDFEVAAYIVKSLQD
jgi:hypothetical protein